METKRKNNGKCFNTEKDKGLSFDQHQFFVKCGKYFVGKVTANIIHKITGMINWKNAKRAFICVKILLNFIIHRFNKTLKFI